jgi:hypothetical protein
MSSPDMRRHNIRMRELEEQLGIGKLIKGVGVAIAGLIIVSSIFGSVGAILFIVFFIMYKMGKLINQ